MNANLLAIVKQIVAEQGEGILAEPRRVTAFFADLAQDEPKAQKYAFIKCLEHKSAQLLKNAVEPDREACKQQLAKKMYDEEGLDPGLCKETLELLAAVLFGDEKKKSYCKNCGKELQEEWKVCPYCLTPTITPTVSDQVPETGQLTSPATSSKSGSAEYGIEQIKPDTAATSSNDMDITQQCNGCFYYFRLKNECSRYNLPIYEAAKYRCEPSNYSSQTQPLKQPTVPASSNNTANQNTGALTCGQWVFVLLVAVGVAVVGSAIFKGVVSLGNIRDLWWVAWIGGAIMHYIFKEVNLSKKK
jgi:hypothetical protein